MKDFFSRSKLEADQKAVADRRDAIARAILPVLWRHDLKLLGKPDADDMRLLPAVLAAVAYQIADAMEEARNR